MLKYTLNGRLYQVELYECDATENAQQLYDYSIEMIKRNWMLHEDAKNEKRATLGILQYVFDAANIPVNVRENERNLS